MTEPSSVLYPGAPTGGAGPAAAPAARSAATVLYPSMRNATVARVAPAPAAAAPAPAPTPAPAAAPDAAGAAAPAAAPPGGARVLYQEPDTAPSATERATAAIEAERGQRLTPEQALYADSPPTNGPVDFQEPAATARDIAAMLVPPNAVGWDHGAAGQAERQQFAAAMADAGAGRGLTRELWGDFVQATGRPVTITPAAAAAELERAWGPQAAAKVEAARGLIARVATRFPGVIGYLERTGLGNDPAFIRKVAARAARMPR